MIVGMKNGKKEKKMERRKRTFHIFFNTNNYEFANTTIYYISNGICNLNDIFLTEKSPAWSYEEQILEYINYKKSLRPLDSLQKTVRQYIPVLISALFAFLETPRRE